LRGSGAITKLIDEIDTKIIKNLLANARENFSAIATECNVSITTIGDRFAQLVNAGIITGSTIQIDHRSMGSKITCSVLVTVDKNEIKQVINNIQKLPFKIATLYQDPKNRIGLIAGLHDVNELSRLKDSIKRNRFVADVRIDVWTGIKNMPENLDIGKHQCNKTKKIIQPQEVHEPSYELDEIDLQLIGELIRNSMQPFGKLAEQIGTSINTVSRKYKKLLDNRIIRPTIQLDLPKLGYFANVSFALAYSSQIEPNDVIREIVAIKNNYLTIKINGEYDLLIHILLKDLNQLLLTQKQIAEIPGVSRLEMLVYPAFTPWPNCGEYISTF
jgi:DNA-binding Lrp family transcriptional regulator